MLQVWSTITMTPIYVIEPYLETDAGDLFSLVWSSTLQTIYVGCQNTSLQWLDFHETISYLDSGTSDTGLSPGSSRALTPSTSFRRVHKFFDSYPQYERRAADIYAKNVSCIDRYSSDSERESTTPAPQAAISIPGQNVIDSAHYGYIYCMARLEISEAQLATGGGDETVKVRNIVAGIMTSVKRSFQIWACSKEVTALRTTFEFSHGAVLALIAKGDTLYAGCQDGYVKVLDLETQTLIRTIKVQEVVTYYITITFLAKLLSVCRYPIPFHDWFRFVYMFG